MRVGGRVNVNFGIEERVTGKYYVTVPRKNSRSDFSNFFAEEDTLQNWVDSLGLDYPFFSYPAYNVTDGPSEVLCWTLVFDSLSHATEFYLTFG